MRPSFAAFIFFMCLTVPVISQDRFLHMKVSNDIEVIQISQHSYVHVSSTQVPGYGRVGSNGFIFADDGKALLFDTPMNDTLTEQLVTWIKDSLRLRITGFVPNHWHSDCMGGLKYLKKIGIPSYANEKTIAIATSKNLPLPRHSFADSLVLHLGDRVIVCKYYGSAHTTDNIITWIPSERILFGGCMVKETKSETIGNIADADLREWPKTLNRVIAAYPSAGIIIPGHGAIGGPELLKHTLKLLSRIN
jgi:metallo-beta-lactamase class B